MQKTLTSASIAFAVLFIAGCGERVDDRDAASVIDAFAIDGGHDAAASLDVGPTPDAGRDGGSDAGHDGGSDGGHDAGSDGGHDAFVTPPDMGHDAAVDAYAMFTFDDPLQIDMSGVFTVETVAGTVVSTFPPLSAIDGSGYVYVTASFASANFDDGAGLPDDGHYDANADHPPIQLAFRDASAVLDSIVLNDPSAGLTAVDIDVVPAATFQYLYFYLTSTEGASTPTITLRYSDGTSSSTTPTVPDWFQPIDASAPVFVVQQGLSRYSASGYERADMPALYGVAIATDSTRVLQQVHVDDAVGTARLTIYGANAY